MNGGMKSGNAACDTLTQALAPIVALVDGLVSRVDKLERDLSAARLRNDRMRAELLAMEGALGGAQTLIAAGIGETTSWTCDACGQTVRDTTRPCPVCRLLPRHMGERALRAQTHATVMSQAPVMSADQWQAANAFLARLSDLSDNG